MTNLDFKEKFVAYIDILGFENMVESAEVGEGRSLPELLEVVKQLGTLENRRAFAEDGPHICPNAPRVQKNLDFRVTQISDCAVISSEISPASIVNLVHHCGAVVIKLLKKGILCRGYITLGRIYHTDTQVIGTGYMQAAKQERKVVAFSTDPQDEGTPFIEVDQAVCDYVAKCGDACVQEMFARQVETSGPVTAIFPFKKLVRMYGIATQLILAEKRKEAVQNLRGQIGHLKSRVLANANEGNPTAMKKIQHYVAVLDQQLAVCDEVDDDIDWLESPFPARRRLT